MFIEPRERPPSWRRLLMTFLTVLIVAFGLASPPGTGTFASAAPLDATATGSTAIAAGSDHVCTLRSGGKVRCWGANFDGQLGDDTSTSRQIPVQVRDVSGAIAVTAGGWHSCALMLGGTAKCWGDNQRGQLGDGTNFDRWTPVDVNGLSGAIALTAGLFHTCALMADGAAKCWGSNVYGQLGDGTSIDRWTLVDVNGLSGAATLTAGGSHTCALLPGGTAKCWGGNSVGQLGDGTNTDRRTPVDVEALSGATDLTTGSAHTCALLNGGTAKCWGFNESGQVGDGTYTDRWTPVEVDDLSGATALIAGGWHSCALMPGGAAKCWGYNESGQVGDGTNVNRWTPVNVLGLTGASALTADGFHTCALMPDRTAKCWGFNGSGQLGDGTTAIDRWTPVDVLLDGDPVDEPPVEQPEPKHDVRNLPPGISADLAWWDLPDDDDDGVPDHWETNGVWVDGYRTGDGTWTGGAKLDLAGEGATVGKRDLFIYMDYEEGHQLPTEVFNHVEQAFANAPNDLKTTVHFINGMSIPSDVAESIGWKKVNGEYVDHLSADAMQNAADKYGFSRRGWDGDERVPQLAKYFVNLKNRDGGSVIGNAWIKGPAGWVAYDIPGFWGRVMSGNWSNDAKHFSAASNLVHEIGHTLGLNHYGPHKCYFPLTIEDQGTCDHGPTHYRSVMSYAYNVLGVPESGGNTPRLTRIDYSRSDYPWKDWRVGPDRGYLTFIWGQYGENPDFYTHDRGQGLDTSLTGETIQESAEEILKGVAPSAFDAFAAEFDVSERPDFPSIESTDLQFDFSNGPVTGVLSAHDNAGSALELMVVEGPSRGTFTTDGLTFVYTPESGYLGEDRVIVRATSGTLSSEPVELTFTGDVVTPPTTTTPTPEPPGPCTGSFCSGR